ncbi:MAG: hypothetical protein EON96_01265, partial [Caulobacteraceae bacterium]
RRRRPLRPPRRWRPPPSCRQRRPHSRPCRWLPRPPWRRRGPPWRRHSPRSARSRPPAPGRPRRRCTGCAWSVSSC